MPGTIVIDSGATFAAMLLLSAAPKTRFGSDEPDISRDGERKYSCEVAVTFRPDAGMRAVSEVVTVTVTGGSDPSATIVAGTPVEFDRLRLGVSSPERRDNGRISGGKPFYMASGIRAAHGANGRQPAKSDAAA